MKLYLLVGVKRGLYMYFIRTKFIVVAVECTSIYLRKSLKNNDIFIFGLNYRAF